MFLTRFSRRLIIFEIVHSPSLFLCSFFTAVLFPRVRDDFLFPSPQTLALSPSSIPTFFLFPLILLESSSRSMRRYSSSLSLSEAGRKATIEPDGEEKRAFANKGVMVEGSPRFPISLFVADRSSLHLSWCLIHPHHDVVLPLFCEFHDSFPSARRCHEFRDDLPSAETQALSWGIPANSGSVFTSIRVDPRCSKFNL